MTAAKGSEEIAKKAAQNIMEHPVPTAFEIEVIILEALDEAAKGKEEIIKNYEFMTGTDRGDIRYAANMIAKLENELATLKSSLNEALNTHAEMSTPLGLLPINSVGMRKIVDYAASLKSSIAQAESALQEIKVHVGRLETFDSHFDREKNIKLIKNILKAYDASLKSEGNS